MGKLKSKHGYTSLKQKFYEQNPIPGGAGIFGIEERPDCNEEEDGVTPMNPIEQKDQQLAALQKALDQSRKEVQDITTLRETLVKTKNELRFAKRSSSVARSKIDFAKKVTEQRMSFCISQASPESALDDEIISLYSSLLDEESFSLEGNEIAPGEDFLKVVEEKIENKPAEMERLNVVRNKILEKVKQNKENKQASRERMDSVGSACSTKSKRASTDQLTGERGRLKLDNSSQAKLDLS